jgi:hypothetical protein
MPRGNVVFDREEVARQETDDLGRGVATIDILRRHHCACWDHSGFGIRMAFD